MDGLGMGQRLDGREEAGGGTWMAERRRDEAPGAAWWQGGAGRGGGGVGKASAGAGTGRERRGEGQRWGWRRGPIRFVRSVLMERK